MCGIVGVFNLNPNPEVPETEIRAGMRSMADRGPDDAGFFSDAGIGLGHRRLAVIEPDGGRQPMRDPDTGVILVFNGEIYNFRALRAQLEKRGHVFHDGSDTEVLLRAYLEWDCACTARLSGMFALAAYDPRQQRLFMARDRIGIKPLFYALKQDRLFFASTIPALRCFTALDAAMDLAGVSHYLTTIRTTLGERTLFRDIRVLLPGTHLVAQRQPAGIDIRRYWDYPILAPGDKPDPGTDAAAEQAAGLLADAVREQLISDVPLGGFLSGGLDSSVIAALAHRFTGGHFDAYGIGYDLDGYNEWPFIRDAAGFYGLRCHEARPAPEDYPRTWRQLVAAKGLPVSTPNEILIYELARALRREFTVALSGEGADEIFGGYTKAYFSAHDYERARHDPPAPGAQLTPTDLAMQRLYRRPYLLCRADHFFLNCAWIPFRQKRDLLQPGIWRELQADRDLFAFYDDWFARLEHCTTMDAYMHIHARVNLEGLLFRVDTATMAASVEARVPYTDHRLAEYLFTLPDRYKIRWRTDDGEARSRGMNIDEIDRAELLTSKLLLRRAFRGQVPESILHRPKMSFPAPVLEWFDGPLRPIARDALATSELGRIFFRERRLQHLLDTAAYTPSATALWAIVNLCLWQIECGATLP